MPDWSRWRTGSFGPASELPYRRRTSDRIRVVLAVLLLAAFIAHWDDPTQAELDLFKLVNGLPDDLSTLFRGLYAFGTLWAVGIVVFAALVARRWRLARDLALAGALAWVLGRFIGAFVVSEAGVGKAFDAVTRLNESSPAFPVVRLAVLVAIVCAASPYLTRPMRRVGQLLALVVAISVMYLGTGVPDAILAAFALGWGLAAAVHLAFGSPGGRPTRAQVQAALAELGVEATDVELAPDRDGLGARMTAHDATGPLEIRVLGRDEADAQLLSRFWRLLLYKEGGAQLYFTRLEEVEHDAFALVLAARAGVRVPELVVAGTAGPNTALAAVRPLAGTTLAERDPDSVDDALLDDLWRQVAEMHGARVAHGALHADHVVVTSDGRPGIVSFDSAATAATGFQRGADVAELLVATGALVGGDRAVASAVRGIGATEVAAALPFIQPAALSRQARPRSRKARKEFGKQLEALRAAAAVAVGEEEPPLQQLYRVNTTSLLMAVGTLIAVFALLSQVGDPEQFYNTIKNADWFLLLVAMIISFLTNFATAVALMGTVPIALPLVRTAELQLSMSFSNLAVPAVGGMAAQIRFLQKQGVDLASAVASGGVLTNVGNIVQSVVLLFVAIWLSPTTIQFGSVPTSSIVELVLIVIVVGAVAAGIVFGVPKVRALVMPPLVNAWTTIREAMRSPKRVALLLGGNMVNSLMYALVLLICIDAFGGSLNYWTVLALNIFIGTIASLVPIPGGGTAVASVGMSGALTAVGVPTEIAVAAVLANQLVANFIPAVPGWFATRDLLGNGYL
ncbi:MAG TPA: lysylphosphatidylglycerol synthase transmembrane domain-containing protein [Gaiellaceae bacterium]|jgi:undecaprenyl-diphosphatase|nr:lysylphosphatidylglycerol synthase transmembrane domain-containing protein [Gaiellaceae bacterium]